MGRTVNPGVSETSRRARVEDTPPSDEKYSDRLVKYVPTESVAAYLATNTLIVSFYGIGLDGTVARPDGQELIWSGVAFFALLIGTPIYIWIRRTRPDSDASSDDKARLQKAAILNVALATIAFGIWALGIGGAFFVLVGWYSPVPAAVLPILATFGFAAFRIAPPRN